MDLYIRIGYNKEVLISLHRYQSLCMNIHGEPYILLLTRDSRESLPQPLFQLYYPRSLQSSPKLVTVQETMNIDVAMSLYFYKPKGRADEAYYWLIRHNRLNSLRMVNLFVISFFSCSLCSRLFASGDEFLLIDARLYCRTCHEQSDIDHVRPGCLLIPYAQGVDDGTKLSFGT